MKGLLFVVAIIAVFLSAMPSISSISCPYFNSTEVFYNVQSYNITWDYNPLYSYTLEMDGQYNLVSSYFLVNTSSIVYGNHSITLIVFDGNEACNSTGYLYRSTNKAPSAPTIYGKDFDILVEQPWINFTDSIDPDGGILTYYVFENDVVIATTNFSGKVLLTAREGTFRYKICVSDTINTTCSNEISVNMNGAVAPVILESTGYDAWPVYDDTYAPTAWVLIGVSDAKSLSVQVNFSRSEHNIYGADYDNTTAMQCSQQAVNATLRNFNCTAKIYSKMQPGFYDVTAYVSNDFNKSVQKKFENKILINVLLSANITNPGLVSDTFSGWSEPIPTMSVTNRGNIEIMDGFIKADNIACKELTMYADNDIMISEKSNRGAASIITKEWNNFNMTLDSNKIKNVYLFMKNNFTALTNCRSEWMLDLMSESE